jgi:hypothetical protein
MDLKKLVIVDIETAGIVSTYDDLTVAHPRLAELWHKRTDWLRERYPENKDLGVDEMWKLKSGLHPEFGRVVCVTFGQWDSSGEYKINSFYGGDELDILKKTNIVLNNAYATGHTLGGHTIERFDVPFLWKRMLINKIKPSGIITVYDKKPWDLKFMDIAKFWSGGAWQESFTSLDTMSAVFGIASPKAEMQANRVHLSYYAGDHEGIKKYCEGDVVATMDLCTEFSNTLSNLVSNAVAQ